MTAQKEPKEPEIKETVTVKTTIEGISPDDTKEALAAADEQIISLLGAIKARGCSSAKMTITLKSTSAD